MAQKSVFLGNHQLGTLESNWVFKNRGLFGGSQMLLSLCDFFNLSRNLVLDTHWVRLGPTECLAAHDAKGEQVQHLFLKIFQLVPLLLKFYLVDNLMVGSIFVHNHILFARS